MIKRVVIAFLLAATPALVIMKSRRLIFLLIGFLADDGFASESCADI